MSGNHCIYSFDESEEDSGRKMALPFSHSHTFSLFRSILHTRTLTLSQKMCVFEVVLALSVCAWAANGSVHALLFLGKKFAEVSNRQNETEKII